MTITPKNAEFLSLHNDEAKTLGGKKVLSKLREKNGDHKIAVGLSGGVDSSLTAALLVQAGWQVEGLTLWLMSGKGSCCSDGLIDAAGICEQLGIPHHVVDNRETFKKEIIDPLIHGYKEGITPSPCSICNRFVKFSPMIKWANKNLGVNRIATGHYARIRHIEIDAKPPLESPDRHQLLRGLDQNKDQSYFLYDLSQDLLEKIMFPLGELEKSDTRREAIKLGLRTAEKPESQDLCLAEHHGSMKDFLDKYLPSRKGEIILKGGQVLGEHDGIEHFTIGQRKGLGIAWKEPLHVIELVSSSNRVIVAPRSEASKSKCTVGTINWVSIEPLLKETELEVQLRYRSHPVKALFIPLEPSENDIQRERPHRCSLLFESKQFSITPGQAAVFYKGEILLGGGIIETD